MNLDPWGSDWKSIRESAHLPKREPATATTGEREAHTRPTPDTPGESTPVSVPGEPCPEDPNPQKPKPMYVPNHLKWRILLAQELKQFYFERENSHRNCKRIFELYGRYLLGTTYDTFLNYLNQLKYEIDNLRFPPYIVAAIGLLEPLRIAGERLRLRKGRTTWTLLEIAEEMLAVLRERSSSSHNLPNRQI